MLGDIAGIGPVRDALVTTNSLLEQVLAELRAVRETLEGVETIRAVPDAPR